MLLCMVSYEMEDWVIALCLMRLSLEYSMA